MCLDNKPTFIGLDRAELEDSCCKVTYRRLNNGTIKIIRVEHVLCYCLGTNDDMILRFN